MKAFAFSLFAVLISGPLHIVSGECDGLLTEDKVTALNFFDSTVTTNTLHLVGGELRYANIGVFENEPLDLVVTITSGTYTDITQVWDDRDLGIPNGKNKLDNGDEGAFGAINLQTTPKPNFKSGEGNFKMCIVNQNTNVNVALEQFTWSIYDLDNRRDDDLVRNRFFIKEKFIMDAGQAQVYQLVDTAEFPTQVVLSCEDGSPASLTQTCPSGVRTIFHSSEKGTSDDNPEDPANLTDLQKQRSVSFTFVNRSCWTFTYDHYCPLDQPEYTGSIDGCWKYTGGYFLFSGESQEIIESGECLEAPPPPPTLSPSENPTDTPSGFPSGDPTRMPSRIPTSAPSSDPTGFPSDTPSVSPSQVPSGLPTNDPTGSPTPSPSDTPSVSPSQVPSGLPTNDPSGSPTMTSNSPTLLPPSCPEDVTIINTDGITEIDAGQAVRILEQDTTSVTVRLYQGWTSSSSTVDRIYYSYRHSSFSQKCHVANDVIGSVDYEDITIQCYRTKAFALLEICVVDSGGALDPAGDNAEIAQCCYPDSPEETPAACYRFVVTCDSVCADTDAVEKERRILRGIIQSK